MFEVSTSEKKFYSKIQKQPLAEIASLDKHENWGQLEQQMKITG